MGFRDIFKRPAKDEIVGTKIVIASLDPKFADLVKSDLDSYSKSYAIPTVKVLGSIQELSATIESGYDVVHLFCDVSPEGYIIDGRAAKIMGTDFLQLCSKSDVKLLWIASDNKGEGYTKGFKAAGKHLNVILTMDRCGPKFSSFLDALLPKMSAGETMPRAWVSLASLNPNDPRQRDLPVTVGIMGRGGVKLRR